MRSFKDSEGREWQVAINISSIKRVRESLKLNGENIDLLAPLVGTPPLITRLFIDLCLLVDVLYVLCRSQANERQLSDEDFGAAIAGEEAKAAYEAFFEELMDFFRKAGREEAAKITAGNLDLVRQEWDAEVQAIERLTKMAPEAISNLIDQTVAETIGRIRDGNGKMSMNSPDSPELRSLTT